MFHFPASPPAPYELRTRVTPHHGRRVPPFGNPRITARKPAPRGISQATASFIGPRCQGIHRTLITTNHNKQTHNNQHTAPGPAPATTAPPTRGAGRTGERTTGAHKEHPPQEQQGDGAPREPNKKTTTTTARRNRPQHGTGPPTDIIAMMLASTMQFTTNPPTTRPHPPTRGARGADPDRPGRTAPEPDSAPRPPPTRPPTGGRDDPRPRQQAGPAPRQQGGTRRERRGGRGEAPRPASADERMRNSESPLERR